MRQVIQKVIRKFDPQKKTSLIVVPVESVRPPMPVANTSKIDEFLADYDPSRNIAILWDMPAKHHFFYKSFFEEQQVLFIKSSHEFLMVNESARLNVDKITVFTLLNEEARRNATVFSKQHGITIVYLKHGLIGHPQYENLPACFLDNFSHASGNYNIKAALTNVVNTTALTLPLVERAAHLRAIYCLLKIGRGSSPSFINVEKFLGPKIKKRILILPQSNRTNSKSEISLLTLAIQENPDAEIFLYKKEEKRSFKLVSENIIIDNHVHSYRIIQAIRTTDLIIACDHVYTDHSLDAVDAIFYHKTLTVTGNPLYSGWGLTDDRTAKPSIKKLSIDEFFAIIFLKCTRYCYDNDDPITGLLSTMLDIAGSYAVQKAHLANGPCSTLQSTHLYESEYWPLIFNIWTSSKYQPLRVHLNLSTIYPLGKTTNFALSAAIIGATANTPHFTSAMKALKQKVPATVISEVLQRYINHTNCEAAIKEAAGLFSDHNEWEKAYAMWKSLEEIIKTPSELPPRSGKLISPELYEIKLNMASLLIRQCKFSESEDILFELLLSGFNKSKIFTEFAEICEKTFRFQEATVFHELALKLVNPEINKLSVKHLELFYILGDAAKLLELLCLGVKSVPTQSIHAYSYRALLQERFGADFPYAECFLNASKSRLICKQRTETDLLSIAHGHMLLQKPEKQLAVLASIKNPKRILKYNLSKVAAYVQAEDYGKAREIIEKLLTHFPEVSVYREAVRLALLMNDYIWAELIFQNAELNNIQKSNIVIDASLLKRFLFNTNRIEEGFTQFRYVEVCNLMKNCLMQRYIQQSSDVTGNNLLVVALSGIGDEIRIASLCPKIMELFPSKKVNFTCEPRLLELLVNSYPNIEFFPVSRQRSLSYKTPLENYNELPTRQLHSVFDNHGWKLANDFDSVTLTTDLLPEFLKDKNSFSSLPYLRAQQGKIDFWSDRLSSSRIKIGLSWRSSLLSYSRNTAYLSIQHLKPFLDKFTDTNVEFFNLQYDDATEELAWAAKNCKNTITHFHDLDQYNDISSTAAFMSCLDLIIAPTTSVIELAGALGRPSFLLSNLGEIGWRKKDESSKTDVWSKSIVHIEGDIHGCKSSLVDSLIHAVELFISNK